MAFKTFVYLILKNFNKRKWKLKKKRESLMCVFICNPWEKERERGFGTFNNDKDEIITVTDGLWHKEVGWWWQKKKMVMII